MPVSRSAPVLLAALLLFGGPSSARAGGSRGEPPAPPPAPAPPVVVPPAPPPGAPAAPAVGPGLPDGTRLDDRAAAWGLPAFESQRVSAVDLDGDGVPDLVFNQGLRVFHGVRTKDGCRFEDVTDATGLKPAEGVRGAAVLAWGDVDGDGDVDCFYGRNSDFAAESKKAKDDGLRSEIYLNDGKGHFTPRPGSGVGEHAETTAAATFVDVDRDGVLDLFVGSWYVKYGEGLECFPSRLYHGNGDGTFTDVTEKAGMLGREEPGHRDSRRPVYGVTHADWDDDGDEDLFVCAYGRQWNVLWRNDGNGHFTDVAEETRFDGDADRSGVYPAAARENPRLKDLEDELPFRSNGNTFDAPVADFDGDGDLDVFLAEITHWWAGPSSDRSTLLVNLGKEKGFAFAREERGIVRAHPDARWNQGDIFAGWLDLGMDGHPDLFLASGDYPDEQRLRFFRQTPEHAFVDATEALGVRWTNCTQPTVADFDGNGAEDLCLGDSNTRLSPEQTKGRVLSPAIFAQTAPGAWITLHLEGKGRGGANRSAIGARITVRAGDLRVTREIQGSRGCGGHVDFFDPTIGVGAADTVSVEVRWPDATATVQRFPAVATRKAYVLREGGAPTPR